MVDIYLSISLFIWADEAGGAAVCIGDLLTLVYLHDTLVATYVGNKTKWTGNENNMRWIWDCSRTSFCLLMTLDVFSSTSHHLSIHATSTREDPGHFRQCPSKPVSSSHASNVLVPQHDYPSGAAQAAILPSP